MRTTDAIQSREKDKLGTQARDVVYLIDDDAFVRESIVNLLDSFRIRCIDFPSAIEYLEYTREDDAACLILDVQLPGISGLELQTELTKSGCPPIVFISGYGDIPSSVQAIKAGAIEFLTKPINSQALISAASEALSRDRVNRRELAMLAELKRRSALLTPREREVFPLLVSGMLNKQSASALGISEGTLQVHRGQIMRKMDADSFAELVRMASHLGVSTSRTQAQ